MDQAITRAAGAAPSTTPPAAAAPRLVGEFQGYVEGQPSVVWADRKNMPAVGSKLFALPPRAAAQRSWSILLTSANHGVVGPLGHIFKHAGEHHERVVVTELVEAGAPPAPGLDLAGLVRFDFSDLDGENEQFGAVAGGAYFLAHEVEARCAAHVAAQAGQVAVPEMQQSVATHDLSDDFKQSVYALLAHVTESLFSSLNYGAHQSDQREKFNAVVRKAVSDDMGVALLTDLQKLAAPSPAKESK